jgi:hypothetical protein
MDAAVQDTFPVPSFKAGTLENSACTNTNPLIILVHAEQTLKDQFSNPVAT